MIFSTIAALKLNSNCSFIIYKLRVFAQFCLALAQKIHPVITPNTVKVNF